MYLYSPADSTVQLKCFSDGKNRGTGKQEKFLSAAFDDIHPSYIMLMQSQNLICWSLQYINAPINQLN